MKHVKLYESWDEGQDNYPDPAVLSPDEFEAEIEKAIQMEDPVAGALRIQKLIRNLKDAPEDMKVYNSVRKYKDYTEGLTPQQREDIKKALASTKKSEADWEADANILEPKLRSALKAQRDDLLSKLDKKNDQDPMERNKQHKSDILDKFAAGEITKEEALAAL